MRAKFTTGVYGIMNIRTGQMYVGASRRIEKRWTDHRRMLSNGTHNNPLLQNEWNVYGSEAFVLMILDLVSAEHLSDAEEWWLKRYKAEPAGVYNIIHPPWRRPRAA